MTAALSRELPLVPAPAALLLIDVQNFGADRRGGEFAGVDDWRFRPGPGLVHGPRPLAVERRDDGVAGAERARTVHDQRAHLAVTRSGADREVERAAGRGQVSRQ